MKTAGQILMLTVLLTLLLLPGLAYAAEGDVIQSGDCFYRESADGTLALIPGEYFLETDELIIPDAIDGKPVTVIETSAAIHTMRIELPEGLLVIKPWAIMCAEMDSIRLDGKDLLLYPGGLYELHDCVVECYEGSIAAELAKEEGWAYRTFEENPDLGVTGSLPDAPNVAIVGNYQRGIDVYGEGGDEENYIVSLEDGLQVRFDGAPEGSRWLALNLNGEKAVNMGTVGQDGIAAVEIADTMISGDKGKYEFVFALNRNDGNGWSKLAFEHVGGEEGQFTHPFTVEFKAAGKLAEPEFTEIPSALKANDEMPFTVAWNPVENAEWYEVCVYKQHPRDEKAKDYYFNRTVNVTSLELNGDDDVRDRNGELYGLYLELLREGTVTVSVTALSGDYEAATIAREITVSAPDEGQEFYIEEEEGSAYIYEVYVDGDVEIPRRMMINGEECYVAITGSAFRHTEVKTLRIGEEVELWNNALKGAWFLETIYLPVSTAYLPKDWRRLGLEDDQPITWYVVQNSPAETWAKKTVEAANNGSSIAYYGEKLEQEAELWLEMEQPVLLNQSIQMDLNLEESAAFAEITIDGVLKGSAWLEEEGLPEVMISQADRGTTTHTLQARLWYPEGEQEQTDPYETGAVGRWVYSNTVDFDLLNKGKMAPPQLIAEESYASDIAVYLSFRDQADVIRYYAEIPGEEEEMPYAGGETERGGGTQIEMLQYDGQTIAPGTYSLFAWCEGLGYEESEKAEFEITVVSDYQSDWQTQTAEEASYTDVEGLAVVTGYTGQSETVSLPATVNGKTVAAVREEAFKGTGVKTVKAETGVPIVLLKDAFRGSSVTTVELDASVLTAYGAFDGMQQGAKVLAPAGSMAQKVAQKAGVAFEAKGTAAEPPAFTMELLDVSFENEFLFALEGEAREGVTRLASITEKRLSLIKRETYLYTGGGYSADPPSEVPAEISYDFVAYKDGGWTKPHSVTVMYSEKIEAPLFEVAESYERSEEQPEIRISLNRVHALDHYEVSIKKAGEDSTVTTVEAEDHVEEGYFSFILPTSGLAAGEYAVTVRAVAEDYEDGIDHNHEITKSFIVTDKRADEIQITCNEEGDILSGAQAEFTAVFLPGAQAIEWAAEGENTRHELTMDSQSDLYSQNFVLSEQGEKEIHVAVRLWYPIDVNAEPDVGNEAAGEWVTGPALLAKVVCYGAVDKPVLALKNAYAADETVEFGFAAHEGAKAYRAVLKGLDFQKEIEGTIANGNVQFALSLSELDTGEYRLAIEAEAKDGWLSSQSEEAAFRVTEPSFIYEKNGDGWTLTGANYEDGADVVIPDEKDGEPITAIENGALDAAAKSIRLPEGLKELNTGLIHAEQLERLEIPGVETLVQVGVFDELQGVTIYGHSGSVAERLAQGCGIDFQAYEEHEELGVAAKLGNEIVIEPLNITYGEEEKEDDWFVSYSEGLQFKISGAAPGDEWLALKMDGESGNAIYTGKLDNEGIATLNLSTIVDDGVYQLAFALNRNDGKGWTKLSYAGQYGDYHIPYWVHVVTNVTLPRPKITVTQTVKANSGDPLTVSWKPVTGADGYIVSIYRVENDPFSDRGGRANSTFRSEEFKTDTASWTETAENIGLTEGSAVVSVKAFAEGKKSSEGTATLTVTAPDADRVFGLEGTRITKVYASGDITIPDGYTIGSNAIDLLGVSSLVIGEGVGAEDGMMWCAWSLTDITLPALMGEWPESPEALGLDENQPIVWHVQKADDSDAGYIYATKMVEMANNGSRVVYAYEAEEESLAYDVAADRTAAVTGEGNVKVEETGTLKIPSSIEVQNEQVSVTEIGNGAFAGTEAISVEIPDSVVIIGEDAFKGSRLESVQVPETVNTVGSGAFADCSELKEVSITGRDTVVSEGAFDGSSGLTVTAAAGSTAAFFAEQSGIHVEENKEIQLPETPAAQVTEETKEDEPIVISIADVSEDADYIIILNGRIIQQRINGIVSRGEDKGLTVELRGINPGNYSLYYTVNEKKDEGWTRIAKEPIALTVTTRTMLAKPQLTLPQKTVEGEKLKIAWSDVEGAIGYRLKVTLIETEETVFTGEFDAEINETEVDMLKAKAGDKIRIELTAVAAEEEDSRTAAAECSVVVPSVTEKGIVYEPTEGGWTVTGLETAAETVEIPERLEDGGKVVALAEDAFADSNIKAITLPKSVLQINANAIPASAEISAPEHSAVWYWAKAKGFEPKATEEQLSVAKLPDMLNKLEKNALSGIAAETVILPAGCKVEDGALANTPELTVVVFKGSPEHLDEDAFGTRNGQIVLINAGEEGQKIKGAILY